MQAIVLIDNIGYDDLAAEWGLAVYINYNGYKLLLDTGTTGRFAKNAQKLGVDLKNVEYGILSHAHYDHADGMDEFFTINSTAKFYLRDEAKEDCYSILNPFIGKYIGIRKGTLSKYENRIEYVSGDHELISGVWLIPHKSEGLAEIGKSNHMYRREGFLKYRPDDYAHEQSLVIDTDKGLVIFNSCSHGGADNIINEVQNTFPDRNIYAIIGGFHLFNKSEEYVRDFAKRVSDTGIKKVYTGHCTKQKAFEILREELGNDKVIQFRSGLEIEI